MPCHANRNPNQSFRATRALKSRPCLPPLSLSLSLSSSITAKRNLDRGTISSSIIVGHEARKSKPDKSETVKAADDGLKVEWYLKYSIRYRARYLSTFTRVCIFRGRCGILHEDSLNMSPLAREFVNFAYRVPRVLILTSHDSVTCANSRQLEPILSLA